MGYLMVVLVEVIGNSEPVPDVLINGVESYWSWSKRRLNKSNGIPKTRFAKHMLESEWRFNHRETLSADLKRLLRR
jgi:transposase-like protein